jgi:leucyl aminopeptidase (aminopeptidase T)
MVEVDGQTFPPFDLVRLLSTVFELGEEETFAVFTDLDDVTKFTDLAYLDREGYGPQKHAFGTLYRGIKENLAALGGRSVDFYAYKAVGGSNLDLPDTVVTPEGAELALRDVLANHSIVLYMGTWSATAPITKLAKEIGFRGATLHGTNDRILATGLAVDYEEVSARAERMRRAITGADSLTLEWEVGGKSVALEIDASGLEMQKSHGLVREIGDVANLPAGEVYYVPTGANGLLPQQFEDEQETIAIFEVKDRAIVGVQEFVRGDESVVRRYLEVIAEDPNAGQITELGIGTQELPWAHADIQDEKILGTAHVATGRSDHLGGDIDSNHFVDKRNASHNDILFTPEKTPDVALRRVTMSKDGADTVLLEDYAPSAFLKPLL